MYRYIDTHVPCPVYTLAVTQSSFRRDFVCDRLVQASGDLTPKGHMAFMAN